LRFLPLSPAASGLVLATVPGALSAAILLPIRTQSNLPWRAGDRQRRAEYSDDKGGLGGWVGFAGGGGEACIFFSPYVLRGIFFSSSSNSK